MYSFFACVNEPSSTNDVILHAAMVSVTNSWLKETHKKTDTGRYKSCAVSHLTSAIIEKRL